MYKSYFGANIEKHLSERWKVGVTIVHMYMETYLCIDLVKRQLRIGKLCRWEND